jgi:hypothetical protein
MEIFDSHMDIQVLCGSFLSGACFGNAGKEVSSERLFLFD